MKPIYVYLTGLLFGSCFGGMCHFLLTTDSFDMWQSRLPAFTVEEKSISGVSTDMPLGTTITIKFLSDAEVVRLGESPDTFATTYWPTSGCTIYFKASQSSIRAEPNRGYAYWANHFMDTAVPHEVLHCLRGSWHPRWDEINRHKLMMVK